MRIIAIRHGEVALNPLGRTTGWLDVELTPLGLEQAETMAASLTEEFSTIIASPLRRTVATAQAIIARHPCKLILDPNLRERNFGSLNSKTWPEIEAETGHDLRPADSAMEYDYRPYGGESAQDVLTRTREFLHTALQYEAEGTLAVVTHGGIIKLLYTLLEYDSRLPITNCSVHIFRLHHQALEAAAE